MLGLTFKPNTDDLREAPSLALITALHDMGASVRAFDPAGMRQAQVLMPKVAYCDSAYDCAKEADALVIVTEWEQFRALDLERLRDLMTTPVIIDLRNIYRPEEMQRHGFAYVSVGRPFAHQSFAGPGAREFASEADSAATVRRKQARARCLISAIVAPGELAAISDV